VVKIFNTIRGIGEMVEELIIVQKVLRSLPLRFDAKFFAIKEMKDFDQSTIDELNGILTTYEMRNEKEKTSRKEEAFKTSKRFGKYKGKLPFKCFNCGKVEHFS
jgi:hypothetical protein